ncbi:C40 family peptidase [Pseudomonas sp. ZM23]|uniref:C40 family peptidase n=1 Tax=Pseudomonas triclosanedens TaxID=2961893 RepID=A0ABY7A4L3_9PSED|nr:C40 family peptidase [Pseudomonas triclosanedens]MCP8464783.1 C40 family peptidase [Pseudomonas triclosanedens]MCP8470504.1 C40 family peptidase [Pseudomonas triclosanedens]MCP8476310.1 C40 family peptidase [Pseudomonas triclosanedens]WAI51461.1 C40 family peptidase [Pseudomonas triclosanedens]
MRSTLLTCLSIGLATLLAATEANASNKISRTYQPAPVDLRVPVQGSALLTFNSKTVKPAKSEAHQVTQRAFSMIGTPYRWGGSSPKRGFDCSGLVNYVFQNVDEVDLPRTAREIYNMRENPKIERTDLQPGDLVFFRIHNRRNVDHVGIYVGDNQFVHAPRRGQKVRVSDLNGDYWKRHYLAAKRILPETLAKADLPGRRYE